MAFTNIGRIVVSWFRCLQFCCLAAACVAMGSGSAIGQVTWDGTFGTPGPEDGGGTWSTSASGTNWWNGTTNIAWPNLTTSRAIFGAGSGAAGTVTVSGGVTTNGITFNAPGSGTYTLSGGTITLAGSTPTIAADVNASIGSVLAGSAGLVKAGVGTLTLTGSSSYTGGTQIDAGVLALGNASAASSGPIVVGSAGTLSIVRNGNVSTGSVSGNGVISLVGRTSPTAQPALDADISGFTGTVNANPSANYTGFGASSTGSEQARFVLSGGVAAVNAFYAAVTGTFRMGELSGTAAMQGAGGAGAVTWEIGGLNTNSTFAGAIRNSLSGSANSLRKVGSGTLTLTGSSNYTGGTQIDAGAIRATNVNAFGSGAVAIGGSGTAAFAAYGTNFTTVVTGFGVVNLDSGASSNQSTIVNFAGDLSGFTGTVLVTSGNDFVGIGGNYLSGSNAKWVVNNSAGSNYLYTGTGTTVAMGELSGNGRIGSNISANTTWEVGSLSTSSTFSGVFVNAVGANSGRAILRKVGSGTLTLTGNSSATGGTEVNGGVLSVGDGGTSGLLTGSASVAAGAVLRFDRSDASSFAGVISGSGSVVKQGAGTLTLSGTSSFVGGTRINAGVIAFGQTTTFGTGTVTLGGGGLQSAIAGTLANPIAITASSGTFDNQANANTLSGTVSGSGMLVKAGAGTLTLSGNNSHSGGTTISAGAINVTNANGLGTGAVAVGSSGTALFHGTGAAGYTIANTITGSGNISVRSNPGGTIGSAANYTYLTGTLSGFSGTVTVDPFQSAVQFGNNALDGSNAKWVITNTQTTTGYVLSQTAGAVVKVGELSGSGRLGAAGAIGGTIWEVGALATSSTFSGAFVNSVGGPASVLRKVGSGTLTLTGSSSSTGGIQLNAGAIGVGSTAGLGSGTLTFGGGMLQSAVTGTIANAIAISTGVSGTFDSQSNANTLSGTISGGGGFVKIGSGTLTLAGNNSFSGGTQVKAGVLAVGDGGTSGSLSGNVAVAAGAELRFNRGNASSFTGVISGSGSLVKQGGGTLTLSGTNTYAGQTRVSAGVLALGAANVIANQSALLVDGGGFNLAGFSDAVATVTITSGSIFGSGTLTGASYALQGGDVNGILGAGPITVSAGTTTLGSAGRFNPASALTISSGRLNLGGSESVASFLLAGGVLGGSGNTLTSAAAYDVRSGSLLSSLGGLAGLVKSTGDTVWLSNANTYAGQTTISAGVLALDVNGSFANSSGIKVGDAGSSGAILDLTAKTAAFAIEAGQTLSGGGTVLVAPGQQFLVQGTFSPGNSPGLFTFDGGTTVLSGTTLMEIFGTSRATSPSHGSGFYDAVNIIDNGTLQFGGNLSFEFSGLFDNNTTFDLFTPAIGSALAGNFTGVTVTGGFYTGLEWNQTGNVWKSSNTTAGQSLEFSAVTGQLVIVPEPGGLALAGMGIAAVGWAAARRRRAIVHGGRVTLCLGDGSVRFPAGDIELRQPARNSTAVTTV